MTLGRWVQEPLGEEHARGGVWCERGFRGGCVLRDRLQSAGWFAGGAYGKLGTANSRRPMPEILNETMRGTNYSRFYQAKRGRALMGGRPGVCR